MWFAGAALAAGGVFLFGATPARADLLPGADIAQQQADQQLADLLGQSNGITLENPLRHSSLQGSPAASNPVMQVKAGQNSPDLNPLLPGESTEANGKPRPQLPAADVVRNGSSLQQLPLQQFPGQLTGQQGFGQLTGQQIPGQQLAGQLPVGGLPLSSLFGGGFPLFGGLSPDGRQPSVTQRPTARQAEVFGGGVPLLGGLGGLLPVNSLQDTPVRRGASSRPDTSGLPAGGTAVRPADADQPPVAATTPAPATSASTLPAPADDPAPASDKSAPAADKSAPADKPAPDATPDDPRLHEEPIDDSEKREFSPDGRPIAGVDPDFN
jgi:hypothetical protein